MDLQWDHQQVKGLFGLKPTKLALSEGDDIRAQGTFIDDKEIKNSVKLVRSLADAQYEPELMQVKGVGRFTAEGVLMLALRRQDVWPAADLALRRAVERVWELDPPASIADVDDIGERFRPWRTLAAVYLYRTRAA